MNLVLLCRAAGLENGWIPIWLLRMSILNRFRLVNVLTLEKACFNLLFPFVAYEPLDLSSVPFSQFFIFHQWQSYILTCQLNLANLVLPTCLCYPDSRISLSPNLKIPLLPPNSGAFPLFIKPARGFVGVPTCYPKTTCACYGQSTGQISCAW